MDFENLISKWKNKGIVFSIESLEFAKFKLTAEIRTKGKYLSIITDDLSYACKVIDLGLTSKIEGEKSGNNHINS